MAHNPQGIIYLEIKKGNIDMPDDTDYWTAFKAEYNIEEKRARLVPKIVNNQYILSVTSLTSRCRDVTNTFELLVDESEIIGTLDYLRKVKEHKLVPILRLELDTQCKELRKRVGDTFSCLLNCRSIQDMIPYVNTTESGLDDHLVKFEKSVEETAKKYLRETKENQDNVCDAPLHSTGTHRNKKRGDLNGYTRSH
jgi:hypothetical protein